MDENDASTAVPPAAQDWVALCDLANEAEAAIVVGFLEAEGIPARVDDRSFQSMPTPDNEDLKDIFVFVPRSQEAEARRVLSARDSAFKDQPEGGETVLTDEGMAEIDTTGKTEEGQK